MSRALPFVVAAALLAQACAPLTLVTGASGRVKAPLPQAPAAASPGARPNAAPVTALGDLLVKPATPIRVLAGQMQVDARYAVGSGSATFISHNGSSVLAMGALKLDETGRLITNDGSTLIATGGGNVIQRPDPIIASGGGNIVAAGGGNAVAPRFRLNEATAAPTAPLSAPAAGMVLEAFALDTSAPIPLGVDTAGHPVFAVYTNELGRFEVYVPAALTGTVRLRAHAPGANKHLQYDLLAVGSQTQDLTLDEDTALVARYMLHAFRAKLVALLQAPDLDDPTFVAGLFNSTLATPAFAQFVRATAHAFRDRVTAARVPPERYDLVAERGAAALLGSVDLDKVSLDVTNTHWDGPSSELAFDALRTIFKQMREDVARVTLAEPHFFDHQAYLVTANQSLPVGQAPYTITKASDLGDFMVGNYFANNSPEHLVAASHVFTSVAPPERVADAYRNVDHLFAATSGIALALATAFVTNAAAKSAVYAVIDATGQTPVAASAQASVAASGQAKVGSPSSP
jgi:hypothetical protein